LEGGKKKGVPAKPEGQIPSPGRGGKISFGRKGDSRLSRNGFNSRNPHLKRRVPEELSRESGGPFRIGGGGDLVERN